MCVNVCFRFDFHRFQLRILQNLQIWQMKGVNRNIFIALLVSNIQLNVTKVCVFCCWLNWHILKTSVFSKLNLTVPLTWWMCEGIKFGVGDRVHFSPFSQLAVISKPSTYLFTHIHIRACTHVLITHCVLALAFHSQPSQTKQQQQHKIETCMHITWSFLSTLESRHRGEFSMRT